MGARSSIGLVGAGLLGGALAERLLTAGSRVVGYDRDNQCLEALRDAGGEVAGSAEQVFRDCRRVVLCLPDSTSVQQVVQQTSAARQAGDLIVDTTTGDPSATVALARQLQADGIGYIDATVAGSSAQARRGEIVLMIGGDVADIQRADDLLRCWSEKRFHVGPSGAGAQMKLVVNLVLGLNRAVLAEGLALAESAGLDLHASLEVLRAGAAYSFAMDAKGNKMIERDFAPQARLDQHLKDVRLIQQMAEAAGSPTPLTDVHRQLLERASAMGLGDQDNSAVINAFRSGHRRPERM